MAEISRRALLGGALLVASTAVGAGLGVSRQVHHKVAVPPAPPPTALAEALSRQQQLLAGYDTVLAQGSRPLLSGLRSDVAAHGDAIRALLELYPGWRLAHRTPDSAGTPPATSVPGLATESARFADQLDRSALAWPAGDEHAEQVVPALASMSAALSTHAQVLR